MTLLCAAVLLGCVSLIGLQVLDGQRRASRPSRWAPRLRSCSSRAWACSTPWSARCRRRIPNSIYSIGYMRRHHSEEAQPDAVLHLCFALALSSVMGIAFSGNLPTLFVFYET
ncbi:MAG: hypothetical protein R3F62_28610 [Planctomycetota bacterium]